MKKSLMCMFLLLFVACGVFAAGVSEAEDGEAKSPWEGKRLEVLLVASGVNQHFSKLIPEFEEKYGVEVDVVTLPPDSYDEKADLELVARNGAFSVVWQPWRTFHRWMQAGWFEPMDGFISDAELVDEDLLDFDGLAKPAINSLTYDGKLMGLPIQLGSMILVYRTDVLEQAGISSPPDTWEELMEYSKKVNGMTVNGKTVYGVGMRGAQRGGGVGFHWPMVLSAFGGSIVKDYPDDMHPSLDTPVAAEAAEFYAKLLGDYGFPGATTSHYLENVVAYQQGQIAFYPSADELTGMALDPDQTSQYIIDNSAFALIPSGPDKRVSAGAVHGLGIPKNAPEQELGYKFIEWITSEEVQTENALENHVSQVVRPKIMLTDAYQEQFNWGDGQWADVVSDTYDKYFDPLFRPMCPEWRDIEEYLGIAMSRVLTGQGEAEEELSKANDEIYVVLKEAGYYDR